ncbi:hypothetical protein N7490_000254 [Penicillium lividum]|nr:hypothetical protein N7490_000254 [Penicillium lividum]
MAMLITYSWVKDNNLTCEKPPGQRLSRAMAAAPGRISRPLLVLGIRGEAVRERSMNPVQAVMELMVEVGDVLSFDAGNVKIEDKLAVLQHDGLGEGPNSKSLFRTCTLLRSSLPVHNNDTGGVFMLAFGSIEAPGAFDVCRFLTVGTFMLEVRGTGRETE